MSAPEPPPSGISEEVSFKNRLQQYIHRASMELPVYQTFNEGFPHAPLFKTRLWVDGTCFTSPNTFSTRKMSEQDAAKHALIGIKEKVKIEGPPRVLENTIFCKSIINEYAVKTNLKLPTYVTKSTKVMVPIFVSSVILNDVTFAGDAAKNKKEAEQLAARKAILSILESESTTAMSEIVKSKFKFYDALKMVKDSSTVQAGNVIAGDVTDGTLACALLEHVNGDSSVDHAMNVPIGVEPLEHTGTSCLGNKRKEIHSTNLQCGDVRDEVDPPKQVDSSSVVQDGNVTVVTNPLDDSSATLLVNKEREVHPDKSDPLKHANGSSLVQTGAVLGDANPLVENDTAVSGKKRKEDHISLGTVTDPFAVNPYSSLLAQVPFQVMHPECALAELPLEIKEPEPQSSSAAIAQEVAIVPPASEQALVVPPASEQALVSSTSGKKRKRKNKKATKKAQDHFPLTFLRTPQTQIPTQIQVSSGLRLS